MNLEQFCTNSELLSKTEIEKVSLLAFFSLRHDNLPYFSIRTVNDWFHDLNLSTPNISRLKNKLQRSNKFIRGGKTDTFKLHAQEIARLDSLFPEFRKKIRRDYNV